MNNLWIFGDSFSSKFINVKPEYVELLGFEPRIFGNYISEEFNLNLKIIAKPSKDNYTIFHDVIDNLDEIQKNDVVIVGWSDVVRFRISDLDENWMYILPNCTNDTEAYYAHFKPNELNKILVNRTSILYKKEINNFIKIINQTIKDSFILHWSWLDYNDELNLDLPFNSFPSITQQTHKEIIDGHYSKEGHLFLSEIMINYMKQNGYG